MTTSLPLFYFKPTICWIDDDQLFLDAVNLSYQSRYYCLTFNEPSDAINFFHTYQPPHSKIALKREFTESDRFGTHNHYPVDININAIHDFMTAQEKINEIAVLVIDYNMPATNGLEVCEKLKSLPFKKILLTGDVDHEKAVDAFNHGLIDKFIKKDHNISDKLQSYVEELIYRYFHERTAHLTSHIEASRPSLLSDPVFMNFFNHWRYKHNIDEFHLINKQGSFICKDINGNSFYFVAMSETDKNEFVKVNDELIELSGSLLNAVSQGKMIPFFGIGKESWEITLSEWKNYFYPCQTLTGRENYYWTVINSNTG